MVTKKIKKCYEQTEIGIIPEDWNVQRLGDLLDYEQPTKYLVEDTDYNKQYNIPVLTAGKTFLLGFTNEETGIYQNLPVIIFDDFTTASKFVTFPFKVKSSAMKMLKPRNEKVNLKFIFEKMQLINFPLGEHKRHWLSEYQNLRIGIPKYDEQCVIAEALINIDKLIEKLDNIIAKKKNVKQGAMQELLTGKKRLQGFNGKWGVKKLGELGESLIGLTYSPSNIKSEGTLVLRSSNVFDASLRFDDKVFVDTDIPDKIKVRKGDILICVRNGSRHLIGKCAHINEHFNDMTFGAFMAVFRTSFHNFVFYQFQSEGIKKQISKHLGATINQITNKNLNSFEIPFTENANERTTISTILSNMYDEIKTLEKKKEKYIAIKKGMMQKLLTGEIRLQ